MGETKKLKTKAGAKGIIFFLIILLILGGVVYAIFFLPPNAEQVKTSINENYNIIKEDADLLKNLNNYKTYAHSHYLSRNDKAKLGLSGIEKNIESLQIYDVFMSEILQGVELKKYERNDIKTITNNLNSANKQLTEISNFFKEKNSSLTYLQGDENHYYYTEAELVLDSVEGKVKNVYKYYSEATAALAKLYKDNVVKGLYANEFANRTVEGVGVYMNYFYTCFNKIESLEYYNMTLNFYNFTNNYLSKKEGQPNVAEYFTTYYSLNKQFLNLDSLINEVKSFSLNELVTKLFNFDASNLTDEQKASVTFAENFLKGGLV